MAATSQRVFRRQGKPGPYTGNRVGPKDHFTPPPAMSSPAANLPGVYSNPDMAYALVAIVGCVVDVQMKSGVAYQGVLKAVSPQLSVALALAHNKEQEASRANTEKLMQLEFADIVSVSVMPEANSSLSSKDIFKTDTEISRSNGSGLSKELQPFSFDDDGSSALTLQGDGGAKGWTAEDMFETNKKKFNVDSSYDEELSEYTTKLDRTNTKDFQERQEKAERLAREIENNSDRHGIDDGGTEEELFSAVVRVRGEMAPPPISFSKAAQSKITPPVTSGSSHGRHPPPSVEGSEVATTGSQTSRTSDDAADSRLGHKAPPDINHLSPPSQGGLSQAQTDGSSSQEFHLVDSTDTDSGNVRGGWTSQESAVSLTEEGAERGGGPLDQCGQVDLVVAEEDEEMIEEEDTEVVSHKVETAAVAGQVAPMTASEGGGEGETGDKSTLPAVTVADSGGEQASKQDDKEKKVRSFRLDPNAKSFDFNPGFVPGANSGAKEFVPSSAALLSLGNTSPLVQSSSSPAVLDSSSYPPLTNMPKKYPNKRGGMAGGRGGGRAVSYNPQEPMNMDYSGGGGSAYMYPQAAGGGGVTQVPVSAVAAANLNLIRHQVPNPQMLQYSASVPQFLPSYQPTAVNAGYISAQQQAVMANPQHMGQKFVGDISPQHQVFAGSQQYPMHMAPHQLMQQPQPLAAHGIVPPGSQAQFSATSTGMVTTPPAVTPPGAMMLVQQQGPTPPAPGAMYTPAAPMQMAGMAMPSMGGQNPGGQDSQYSTFSRLAEGGGVHYIEYPPANSLVSPPYYSSDASTDQIQ